MEKETTGKRDVEINNKKIKIGLAGSILAASVFYVIFFLPTSRVNITIVGTNDMHGAVWPVSARWRQGPSPGKAGGFSALSYHVNRLREVRENVLVVDSGDFFQGTPEGNKSQGMIPLKAMNFIGYDALALGNHEFDYGVEPAAALSREARFPFLAANMRVICDEVEPFFSDYVIFDIRGVRVLTVGVNTSGLFNLVGVDLSRCIEVEREERSIRRIKEKKEGEYDIFLLLSHVGVERDREIAAAVDGIDIIMGGHSHTGLRRPLVVNDTLIMQTYGQNTSAAVLDITYDLRREKITSSYYNLLELAYSQQMRDPHMEELLEEIAGPIREEMDEAVGYADEPLERGWGITSSPLGSFITDIMREVSGADLAFHNRTGIRDRLAAGRVTARDIYEVAPFGNTVVTVDMTGEELENMLEHIFSRDYYMADFSEGVLIYVDKDAGPGDRLYSVKINGENIERDRVYTVATNSFIADGYMSLFIDDRQRFNDTAIVLRQALEERISREETLSYTFTGRVKPLN